MPREAGRGIDDRYCRMTSPPTKESIAPTLLPGARGGGVSYRLCGCCANLWRLRVSGHSAQRTAASRSLTFPRQPWPVLGDREPGAGTGMWAPPGDRPGAVGARYSGAIVIIMIKTYCQHRSIDLDHHVFIFSFLFTPVWLMNISQWMNALFPTYLGVCSWLSRCV